VTTYVSSAAIRATLQSAQERLDCHAACDLRGRCITCGKAEPCPDRLTALRVFARYGRLPRRRRGASLPNPLAN
jgi:hypothetical protein